MQASVQNDLDTRGGGLRAALVFGALAVLLCGLAYPIAGTLLGGWTFPAQAGGSLVSVDGRQVGSALVAQPFSAPGYFQPRPSAAGYDPTAAAGSNYASSNPALRERMAADAAAVAERDGITLAAIPVELISASGSGLDPHLSPAGARVQAARIARARGIDEATVLTLIDAHVEPAWLGLFGAPRVNVLLLNLALDQRAAGG
jgi:K+-transporting ATPase ATPase C chain